MMRIMVTRNNNHKYHDDDSNGGSYKGIETQFGRGSERNTVPREELMLTENPSIINAHNRDVQDVFFPSISNHFILIDKKKNVSSINQL